MNKLTFYGSSDDNFCVNINDRGHDEIGCYGTSAVFEVSDGVGNWVYVVGQYAPKGVGAVWAIGLALHEEDVPIPPWRIEYSAEGYSPQLNIYLPNGFTVDAVRKE